MECIILLAFYCTAVALKLCGKILLHSADMYLYIQMHIGLHLHFGQQIGVNRAKSYSERVAYCS